MLSAAEKLDDTDENDGFRATSTDAAALVEGVVIASEGGALRVRFGRDVALVPKAPSCLLAPLSGDRVLLSITRDGAVVMAVLERAREDLPLALEVNGDLEIRAQSGSVSVEARDGIELDAGCQMSVTAGKLGVSARLAAFLIDRVSLTGSRFETHIERVKTVADTCEEIIGRLAQRLGTSVRFVDDVEQVKAKRMHWAARETLSMRGENTFIAADEVVKVDGKQIHLG